MFVALERQGAAPRRTDRRCRSHRTRSALDRWSSRDCDAVAPEARSPRADGTRSDRPQSRGGPRAKGDRASRPRCAATPAPGERALAGGRDRFGKGGARVLPGACTRANTRRSSSTSSTCASTWGRRMDSPRGWARSVRPMAESTRNGSRSAVLRSFGRSASTRPRSRLWSARAEPTRARWRSRWSWR